MDELARLMDWDLQDIITGCTSEATTSTTIMDNPHLSSSHFCSKPDDQFFNFQEFSETTTVVDELEELYKPFYPVMSNTDLSIVTTSHQPIAEEVKARKPSNKVAAQDLQGPAASKCKRRKKQKEKRVEHVPVADGVCHDPWAWRKYGQKPIKGSPYPRSYYRCSSTKGCLARKRVERSHLDPGVFIVTYTAEHNHPHPTRKAPYTGKRSSIIAPPRTHDPNTPLGVEPIAVEHALSIEPEQNKGLKKEEDVVEGDGWFSSVELEELDGYDFMDATFTDYWFVNQSNVVT